MNHPGHYIERCRYCHDVISQCRCFMPGKEERLGVCNKERCQAEAAKGQG